MGKCEDCQKCPLYNEPQVPAVGLPSAEIMLIGEAPGCFLGDTPIFYSDGVDLLSNEGINRKLVHNHESLVVKDLSYDVVDYPMYRFKVNKLPYYSCTAEHKILVSIRDHFQKNKIPCGCSDLRYLSIEEIKGLIDKGSQVFVVVPKIKDYEGKEITINIDEEKVYKNRINDRIIPDSITLDDDLGFLLGCYMGDGSSNFKEGTVAFHISKGYKEQFKNKIIQILENKFHLPVSKYVKRKVISLCVHSRSLVLLFKKWFGNNCYDKRVPKFIFQAPKSVIRQFLFGWYVTDGSHNKSTTKGQSISSVSKLAIWDGVLLGLKCGVFLGVYEWNSYKENEQPVYGLTFDSLSINKLNFPISTSSKSSPKYGEDDNYFYLKVNNVEKFLYTGKVYDKTTVDHAYSIPFIVHNSTEVTYGEPFVGRSGQVLNAALEEVGIDRAKVYITNAVACHPPDNRTPTSEEIKLCRDRLMEEIKQVRPKLIVTLGAVPMRSILKLNGIVKHHGQEVYSDELNCLVLPCYHPAFILRDPRRQHEFLQDIKKIPRLIDDAKPKIKPEYIVVDSFEKLYQMKQDLQNLPAIAFDIETNGLNPFMEGANVTAISFSGQYGKSYCVPLYYQAPVYSTEFLEELTTYLRNLFLSNISSESIPPESISVLQESWLLEKLRNTPKHIKNYHKLIDAFIEELKSQRKNPLFSEEEINNLIIPVIREILEDPNKELIAHNGKFDIQWLRYKHGLNIQLKFDTCIAHYLLDENSAHNLKQVAGTYTDIGNYAHDFRAYEDRFNRAPEELFYQYSCADADATYRLYTVFKPLLAEKKLDKTFAMVMKFSESLTDVEYNGVKIDQEALTNLDKEMSKVLEDITQEIQSHTTIKEWTKLKGEDAVFNPNSNDMVREVLFDCLNLPVVKKTKTGAPSVDAETLEELSQYHDLPELLLRYRKQSKLLETYIRGYWKYMSSDGKIHPNFNLVVARTGRLSSSNPNLQNLPSGNVKDIKRLFIPSHPDWVIMNFDFSQIELRVMAMLSRDPVMTKVYQQGEDIHTMTAQVIFKKQDISKEERQMAKKLNFSILYGAGAEATARLLGVTPEEAQSFIKSYFKRYKGVAKYIKLVQQIAEKNGVVYSPYGRARRLPEAQMTTNESIKSKALREAVNHTIQSTASDICQIALAKINRYFKAKKLPANVILTVHDSIVVECHRDYMQEVYHLVKSHMEGVKGKFITVPLLAEAEWGLNYGDMFSYDGSKSFEELMERNDGWQYSSNKEVIAI